jgi:hypothetical protein
MTAIPCNGPGFSTNDASVSTGLRDAVVTYQKKFDNTSKKLEFKLNYNNNTNNFELSPVGDMISILRNLKPKFVQYKV